MAMPIVIAKNQTGSDIDLSRLGLRVPASPGQLTLTDYSTYTECTEDSDLESAVSAGNIVINDGTVDLTTAEALVYLNSSGNLNGPPTGAAVNLLLKLEDSSGTRTIVTGVTVDNSDNITTSGSVTASNFFLTGAVPFGLQEAYDNGNDITTAGATDIAFTLTSGNLAVDGAGSVAFTNAGGFTVNNVSGPVAFGNSTEVASFSAFSASTMTLQSRDTTLLDMQANNAADKNLTISSSNAGAGAGNLLLNVGDLTTLTSQLGEAAALLRLTQSGTGGDSADLFVGTSEPSGTISARAASWFFRDTGTGAEAYQNISTGSGTDWARNVNDVNHKTLRDLIHFIDDGPADGFATGSYKETQYDGALITQEIWWEDNTKTQKIVQLDVTYDGALPVTEVWQMFDEDGTTVLLTLTDTVTYSGALESSRDRAWV